MVYVKIYRIEGEISSPNYKSYFSKDIQALKPEDAIEKVYKELGSQHRVKRVHIKMTSIKEILLDETDDPLIRALRDW